MLTARDLRALEDFSRKGEAIARQFATAKITPLVLEDFSRKGEAIARQLAAVAAPVWPVDGSSPQRGAAATAPSINWMLFGQLTLRALFAAIILALILAAWEEQKESAPAMALLEIFGALGLWYEIDGAIWRRLS